ncbi:MAG: glucuronate isomerase [Clostridiales bacterium]|jgi:glucuronate isomerase|nr:glucuronate isomerase [Clostridiales bacterium]
MSVKSEILKSPAAEAVFDGIKELPIVDYHCHLSPREIYEDVEFRGISQMFLSADHYKWRLMRTRGIDEKYITGDAEEGEKFAAYLFAAEGAYGNPLRDFTRLELSKYFGIDLPLKAENAGKIRAAADAVIREKKLSPRKLIEASSVEYIATTDDPADPLVYHEKIKKTEGFKTAVVPTFRADRLFNISMPDFSDYVGRLAEACGFQIESFEDFLRAIEARAADFSAAGCSFADIGIEDFPDGEAVFREGGADKFLSGEGFERAKKAFVKAKNGGKIPRETGDSDSGKGEKFSCQAYAPCKNGFKSAQNGVDKRGYYDYLGFMFPFFLTKCREYGFTAQLHLGVLRNVNDRAFSVFGADTGFDTVAERLKIDGLRAVLNSAEESGGLPKIILYTLNPAYYYPLITLAGAFRGVFTGAPWWFNDHKNGMNEYFSRMSELSHIGQIPGMLTDSRSFLSYARHDYFRMVLAEYLSRFDDGDGGKTILKTAEDIAYFNIKKFIKP